MLRVGLMWLCLAGIFAPALAQAEPVPFYIFIGQSNSGWLAVGGLSVWRRWQYGGTVPETEIWNPAQGGDGTKWEPLIIGRNTSCGNAEDSTAFGAEASLFASLQKQETTRRLLYKQAHGGTSLAVDWKPGSGSSYARLASWLPMAVAQADARGDKLQLQGILWMQGETDAETEAFASAYLANLREFFVAIDALWQRLVERHGLPRTAYRTVVGRINAPCLEFRGAVREAQEKYCADPAHRAVMIDTDAYPLEWVHYTAEGQIQFGLDIYRAAKFEP